MKMTNITFFDDMYSHSHGIRFTPVAVNQLRKFEKKGQEVDGG